MKKIDNFTLFSILMGIILLVIPSITIYSEIIAHEYCEELGYDGGTYSLGCYNYVDGFLEYENKNLPSVLKITKTLWTGDLN